MTKIKALGEIALRVNDLKSMVEFYENTIGLTLMRLEKQFAFFKITEGFEGHTQVLALFDRSQTTSQYTPPNSSQTSVDHIAFSIAREDFEGENQRLRSLGVDISHAYHDWVKWKSLYVVDPEGNTVELVCHAPHELDQGPQQA